MDIDAVIAALGGRYDADETEVIERVRGQDLSGRRQRPRQECPT